MPAEILRPASKTPVLPSPADLDRIANLPLIQMFVIGRSGSGLVHAFLDGHPAVLHVPHTFKFYDFVAANPDVLAAPAEVLIQRFIESPLVAFLFDTNRSVILRGRLGADMKGSVTVDVEKLRAAFLSAAGGRRLTPRLAFLGIVLAYGWSVGQDVRAAQVVFHHLHHGDWLWPEDLIEPANCSPALPGPAADVLKADRYIASVREPHDAFASIVGFAGKLGLDEGDRLDAQELLVRLLLQDWLRLRRARTARIDLHVIRIEDLRVDAAGVMRTCARWMGIDPNAPALARMTYYGLEWFGDIYTSPASQVKPAGPPPRLAWQDRSYLDDLLGDGPSGQGYGRTSTLSRWLNAVQALCALVAPSPLLWLQSPSRWQAYRRALELSWRRFTFARRYRAVLRRI